MNPRGELIAHYEFRTSENLTRHCRLQEYHLYQEYYNKLILYPSILTSLKYDLKVSTRNPTIYKVFYFGKNLPHAKHRHNAS